MGPRSRLLTKAVDDVRPTGIESVSNNLSGLLVHYLVELGRIDEAGRVWLDRGMPHGVSELLDLERQSWRAMEALSHPGDACLAHHPRDPLAADRNIGFGQFGVNPRRAVRAPAPGMNLLHAGRQLRIGLRTS